MNAKIIAITVLAIVIAVAVGLAGGYNSLVKSNEAVNEAWSQVENVYQRRLDLIPNLVETVKGYAQHERSTFQAVTEARAKVSAITISPAVINDPASLKNFQAAQDDMGRALGRLIAIAENYPDLKANENFLALQNQLEGTENRIAVERRRFNETVRAYNVKVKQFPRNILAAIFNFKQKAYFEAESTAGRAPSVKF